MNARPRLIAVVLLAALSQGCTEYNPVGPAQSVVRSNGEWVLDDALEGVPRSLSIAIDTLSLGKGAGVPMGTPLASGSVAWPGGSCPATMRLGTPNNPKIPEVWVDCSGSSEQGVFPWDARARGFGICIYAASGDSGDLRRAHPSDDWLFVVFDDSVFEPGDNWTARFVRYVRADS